MYVFEDILIPVIMGSRLSDLKTIKFRSDLGFNQNNLILKKEQWVVIPLLKVFCAEKIKLQHKALKNERVRTDMYFFEHKFAVEVDEKGHTDRNQDKENERQAKIEKYSHCRLFYRINCDLEDFDIFLKIVKYRVTLLNQNKEELKKEKEVEIKELKEKLGKLEAQIKESKNEKN